MEREHQRDVGLLHTWAHDDPLFAGIDWGIVYAFLVGVACEQLRHCKPDEVACGVGETPRDFALQTCFLMLEHEIEWPPRYPLTTPVMCGVLRNVMCHDILDRIRVRRGASKVKLDYEQPAQPEFDPQSDRIDALTALIAREGDGTVKRFLDEYRGDPDPHPAFPSYFRLMLRNPCLPPRKAAAMLGVSIREVNEMRRRLLRRIHRFFAEEALLGRTHSPRRRKRSNPS